MKLLTDARVENSEEVVVAEVGNATAVGRDAFDRSRRCRYCYSASVTVTIACVIVTSLTVSVCALVVSSIQRDVSIDKLQRQVAELQQAVATLQHRHHRHHHQQQQQQQQQHNIIRLHETRQYRQHELPITTVRQSMTAPCSWKN